MLTKTLPLFTGRLLLLTLAMLSLPSVVVGQTFRMETDVFLGDKKEPICQTLTLFSDGLVYDFLTNGEANEVTVYNMNAQRMVLLDTKRAVKTVLGSEQLIQHTASMKAVASDDNPVFHFAAHPKFDVKFDEFDNVLTLSSPTMTYWAKGVKPEHAAAALTYQEFADWSARLNACRAAQLAPFARMELSREMAERGFVPEEIKRTIVTPGRFGDRKMEVRSRHLTNWILSTKDRKRIEIVGEQISKFEVVSLKVFLEPESSVAKN